MSTKTPSAVVSFNAVPEDAADPDVKVYVNGELVESGGGGGGDLSACKITFDAESGSGYVDVAYFIEIPDGPYGTSGKFRVTANAVADAILFKGKCYVEKKNVLDTITVVSGSAVDADGMIEVSGDCVLNYSPAQG